MGAPATQRRRPVAHLAAGRRDRARARACCSVGRDFQAGRRRRSRSSPTMCWASCSASCSASSPPASASTASCAAMLAGRRALRRAAVPVQLPRHGPLLPVVRRTARLGDADRPSGLRHVAARCCTGSSQRRERTPRHAALMTARRRRAGIVTMAIALVLLVIVVGFGAVPPRSRPWWTTPLASNWKRDGRHADDHRGDHRRVLRRRSTCSSSTRVWRYRHREGQRAAYEPENHAARALADRHHDGGHRRRCSRPGWRSMPTTCARRATRWCSRWSASSGNGATASPARAASSAAATRASSAPTTRSGSIRPTRPAQDNIVVIGNEVHLPLDRPVKVLLRSHDVLHDFFVPQFRARMNIVPGQVSTFWFTPTRPGRYESMCAQLCGVGHPNMRGFVVVEDEAAFQAWLRSSRPSRQTLAAARRARRRRRRRWSPAAARSPSPRAAWPATRSTAAPASGRPGRACSARPRP